MRSKHVSEQAGGGKATGPNFLMRQVLKNVDHGRIKTCYEPCFQPWKVRREAHVSSNPLFSGNGCCKEMTPVFSFR